MNELVKVGQVSDEELHAVAVSDDGALVVLGRPYDLRLQLVEVVTGTVRAEVVVPGDYGARVAALTRDGSAVAVGSGFHHNGRQHLFWWDLASGAVTELPTEDVREMRWVAPRADARYLAAVGRSSKLAVVEVATRALVFTASVDKVFPRWIDDALVFQSDQGGRVFRPETGTAIAATERELRGRWDGPADRRGAYEQDGALRVCGERLLWATGDAELEVQPLGTFDEAAISGGGRALAVTVRPDISVWRAQ